MPYIFNTIGLIGKYGDPTVAPLVHQIAAFLKKRNLQLLLEEETACLIDEKRLPTGNRRSLARHCDLVIVLGGDGTFLNAARAFVDFRVPLLGVNLGRLGFLTDISPHPHLDEALHEILVGKFKEEERGLLHVEVRRDGQAMTQADALNDVVIHKREMARMIEVDTYIDGMFLNAYWSDGLIIATPTGSTAYSLSSGGPIVHPSLDAVLVVPICPHTLTHRPILLNADREIEIRPKSKNPSETIITCDGQITLNLALGDRIVVRQKRRKLRLIQPLKHDYFQVLRAKLGWGAQSTQET